MPDPAPALDASTHFAQGAPFYAALACYVAALAACLARPRIGLWLTGIGAVVHFGATLGRGWAIGFFPLTNKMESFSAAALALALVTLVSWRDVRLYVAPLLALVCISLFAALFFPLDLSFPPPLMQTLWYPLHVPLSFLAYAAWTAAAFAIPQNLKVGELDSAVTKIRKQERR